MGKQEDSSYAWRHYVKKKNNLNIIIVRDIFLAKPPALIFDKTILSFDEMEHLEVGWNC